MNTTPDLPADASSDRDQPSADQPSADGPAGDVAAIDAVELYWRPGCGFCSLLERQLHRLRLPLRRHNIWEHPEAAAFVRSVAGGNETVPTVVVGARAMVNPRPEEVLDAVAEHAPHLRPAVDESR